MKALNNSANLKNDPTNLYFGSATINFNASNSNSGVVSLSNPINSGVLVSLYSLTIINFSSQIIRNNAYSCSLTDCKLMRSYDVVNRVTDCSKKALGQAQILYSASAKVLDGYYFVSNVINPYVNFDIDIVANDVDYYLKPGSNNVQEFVLNSCRQNIELQVFFVWGETPLGMC